MPIVDLQRRIAERGRIRIGITATTRTGRKAPRKLDRFRFTSTDPTVIGLIAGLYGGQARPWDNGGRAEHEVITDATDIPIVLPPEDMAFTQWYERWAKGFCTRRCTGVVDQVTDGPCDCDPENRDCKITTRLSVILPEVPGLGTWRLESHGYYAGVELAGALDIIARQTAATGTLVPARLILVEREVRRLIAGKAEVRQFVVPRIDVDLTALTTATAGPAIGAGQAGLPGPAPGWKPVDPRALPPAPAVSVADQLAELDRPKPKGKPRANAAAPLAPTGRRPRTAAQAAAQAPPAEGGTGAGERTCTTCHRPIAPGEAVRRAGAGYRHTKCTATSEAAGAAPTEGAGAAGGRRGGTPSRPARSGPAEPAPDPTPDPPTDDAPLMSDHQRAKLFALTNAVFPDHSDDGARTEVLALAALCGQPGLTSRTQLTKVTAGALIDVLERLDTGEAEWVGGQLLETEMLPFPDDDTDDDGGGGEPGEGS